MTGSEIFETVKAEGRRSLMVHEAKQFLMQHEISVTNTAFASTMDETVSFANQIGYPVVLKIISPDILHKSDVGGVILNLKSDREVKTAYKNLLEKVKETNPSARILGVVVEEMAELSVEVAIGLTRDRQFGPVIMFGLGGIFIEVLKDVTFRVCPVSQDDALEMIGEVKGYPMLKGYRGLPQADLKALASLIVKVSEISLEHPDIEEADLNPVMVHGSEIKVADARIILSS